MTVLVEGKKSFYMGTSAIIVPDDREVASDWASKHITPNPAIKWVLGRYAESDNPNRNKQFWSYEDLQMARPTVDHGPMNMLHRPRHIVGAFVASEMIYPANAPEDMTDSGNPYIEALGAFWKYYFPEEYAVVEMAYNEGSLYYSMECVADTITCAGEDGCGKEFAFEGPRSENYCEHMNARTSILQLNRPHFLGGALIVPPERPGWAGADVRELSALVAAHQEEAEKVFNSVKEEFQELDEAQWEATMLAIMKLAKAD